MSDKFHITKCNNGWLLDIEGEQSIPGIPADYFNKLTDALKNVTGEDAILSKIKEGQVPDAKPSGLFVFPKYSDLLAFINLYFNTEGK